jgi:hypothetical protein
MLAAAENQIQHHFRTRPHDSADLICPARHSVLAEARDVVGIAENGRALSPRKRVRKRA